MGSAIAPAVAESKREAANRRRRAFAAEMRAKGYRRKTMWVIDTRRPGFEEEMRRQCSVIAEHDRQWRLEHPDAHPDEIPGWVGQE